jgi:hypothetical protein
MGTVFTRSTSIVPDLASELRNAVSHFPRRLKLRSADRIGQRARPFTRREDRRTGPME